MVDMFFICGRQTPSLAPSSPFDRDWCFKDRVGSPSLGETTNNWRSLEPRRSQESHKLAGIKGSIRWNSSFHSGPFQHSPAPSYRQYCSHYISESHGRNQVLLPVSSGSVNLELVSGKEIILHADHIPGQSRFCFEALAQQQRLDAQFNGPHKIRVVLSIFDRPFCLIPQRSASNFFSVGSQIQKPLLWMLYCRHGIIYNVGLLYAFPPFALIGRTLQERRSLLSHSHSPGMATGIPCCWRCYWIIHFSYFLTRTWF